VESVWLLLDGGRDAVRRPGLDFLGSHRFAAKTPDYEGWISLDFLGFPRPNRDFSMGYTRFSAKIFSRAFVVAKGLSKRRPTIRHAEEMDCSWGDLSLISDFLQEIAARALAFGPPPSKSKSL
jgi:hypothetical protein